MRRALTILLLAAMLWGAVEFALACRAIREAAARTATAMAQTAEVKYTETRPWGPPPS